MFPAVFVSHGAPTLVFEDIPARQYMAGLGDMLGRPEFDPLRVRPLGDREAGGQRRGAAQDHP